MTRQRLLTTLRNFAAKAPDVLAAWEQGSKAFGRDDAESDLDLSLVAEDHAVEVVAQGLEAALLRDGIT